MINKVLEEVFRQSIFALDRVDGPNYPIKSKIFSGMAFEIFRMQQEGMGGNVSLFLDFLAYALPLAKQSHSQIAQDLWVTYFLNQKQGGTFVEIGAGDGRHLSNTLMLEARYGWGGVLCEPNTDFHQALSARSAAVCENAIGAVPGSAIFNVMEDPYLSQLSGVGSRDLHDDIGNRKLLDTRQIDIITFDEMCLRSSIQNVDFLSLDTEGNEIDILKSIDFNKWLIAVICVEHNWSQSAPEIMSYLGDFGYTAWLPEFTQSDYFMFRPDLLVSQ
jgi:FkbM family methyltransferase